MKVPAVVLSQKLWITSGSIRQRERNVHVAMHGISSGPAVKGKLLSGQVRKIQVNRTVIAISRPRAGSVLDYVPSGIGGNWASGGRRKTRAATVRCDTTRHGSIRRTGRTGKNTRSNDERDESDES